VQREKSICGFITEWSSELCTHPLKKATFVPYQYNLEWTKYPSMLFGIPNNLINNIAVNQQIERIENSSTVSPIAISQNAFTYSDNAVDCKKKYCYKLKVNTSGQVGFLKYASQSISNMICVDRSEIIANAPTDVYLSANADNQNAVFFDKTPNWPIDVNRWILYKKDANQYKKIDSLSNNSDFVLDKTTATKAESYKLSYVDRCESKSAISDSVRSVFMSFQDPNLLNWNIGSPFEKSGIGFYEVEYLEENSDNIKLSKVESATGHEADLKYYEENAMFRLKILSDGSPAKTSYSNTLKVEIPNNLTLPNIFTPNGDAANDMFGVKGKSDNLLYFSLEIFNRFGEKVAQFSNPKDNWDGKIKGKTAPVGIYFYNMSAKLKNGETVKKDGTLELIR
jgi:gliding motility-associated-like protein